MITPRVLLPARQTGQADIVATKTNRGIEHNGQDPKRYDQPNANLTGNGFVKGRRVKED